MREVLIEASKDQIPAKIDSGLSQTIHNRLSTAMNAVIPKANTHLQKQEAEELKDIQTSCYKVVRSNLKKKRDSEAVKLRGKPNINL